MTTSRQRCQAAHDVNADRWRLLVGKHQRRLVLGYSQQQLLLAAREVVEQLTLGGLSARPHVVEGGHDHTAGPDLSGGAHDDPLSGRAPLRRQILDLRVHFQRGSMWTHESK